MSINLFYLYRKSVFQLAKTLVIKSSMAAEAVNDALRLSNIEVIGNAPETWKYYKNIAGEYHTTDRMMRVTSIDTLETIDFTKANLLHHRATAREYQYGSRYYNDLIARFPNQTALVLGILHPVDMDTAIEAEDGTILYYNTALVEDNEVNLIPELEGWIKRFTRRWNNPDYRYGNELYVPAFLGVLFTQLPQVIMNLRLGNCKTRYAHSFHIRAYLASNGRLDQYMDLMTKKQALFLYRNIDYINANAGKQSTFKTLIQNVLTERGFPLTAYDLVHNTSGMPESIDPTVELYQRDINEKRSFGYTANYTVDEILAKEEPLAKDNALVTEDYRIDIEAEMTIARHNTFRTKVLESSVIDDSDGIIKPFADNLLDHWMYLSAIGYYTAVIGFIHPLTGEKLLLNAKDAFVLALYAIAKTQGTTLATIPQIEAAMVRRIVLPTVAEIRSKVNKRWCDLTDINAALADQIDIEPLVSIENFYDAVTLIHARMRQHYYQYATVGHRDSKATIKAAALSNYMRYTCSFYTNQDYDDWFASKGLNVDGLSVANWLTLGNDIIKNATGASLNNKKTLREIHQGMISIMSQLSSYSVQFISTINQNGVIKLDVPEVLSGNMDSGLATHLWIPTPTIKIRAAKGRARVKIGRNMAGVITEPAITTGIHASTHIDTTVATIRGGESSSLQYLALSTASVRSVVITGS
jgi:hypothetical protein